LFLNEFHQTQWQQKKILTSHVAKRNQLSRKNYPTNDGSAIRFLSNEYYPNDWNKIRRIYLNISPHQPKTQKHKPIVIYNDAWKFLI
jgi:hypothetical protein